MADHAPTASAWLEGKTVAELEAIEHEGRVLIPEAMRFVGANGKERLDRYYMRIPTEGERGMARLKAVRLVAEHMGPDAKRAMGAGDTWTIAKAQAVIGADVFENFDTTCIVAASLREWDAPHGPAFLPEILITTYLPATIFDAFERLDFYSKLYNPRLAELTDDDFWKAVAGIAKTKNLGPLAVMRGDAQTSFVVRMAETLWTSHPPSS
jgi:hypothetical protein